jgi:hypothetical protein
MTGELDLVTLLYRADWTRLSLTADVRGMLDYRLLANQDEAQHWFVRSVPPGMTDVRHFGARLHVAPGGRYYAQADGDGDEFHTVPDVDSAVLEGLIPDGPDGPDDTDDLDEGVQTWLTRRYAEMLRPVSLLSGFVLVLRGLATFADRDAYHVVATPSAAATAIAPGREPLDRIEVFVDAATGILLRREEIFEGQTLRFTEFTSARFGPLEAADAAHFAPDPASDTAASDTAAEDPGQDPFQEFSGAGWKAAKTAVDAASAVLGTAIRLTPGGSSGCGSGNADDPEAAIPADDPFPVEWGAEDAPSRPISVALLHALVRGGSVPFTGVFHNWTDLSAMTGEFSSAASRHGWTGVSIAARAIGDRAGGMHKASLVRFGAGGKYRIDVLRDVGKGHPTASACDGERRWRMYPNRVTVGPAGPDSDLAAMADASWLLRYELSGQTELSYRGRPAYAVQVAVGDYPVLVPTGIMLFSARAIIDAELGIVLLFVSALGGRPAMRSELRDVTAASAEDNAAFRIVPPPGTKVVQVSGNPLEEIDVPDAVRTAVHAAGQAARAAERGFTAAKGFFDSLRERR